MAREVHGSQTRSRSVARVAALSSQDAYRHPVRQGPTGAKALLRIDTPMRLPDNTFQYAGKGKSSFWKSHVLFIAFVNISCLRDIRLSTYAKQLSMARMRSRFAAQLL